MIGPFFDGGTGQAGLFFLKDAKGGSFRKVGLFLPAGGVVVCVGGGFLGGGVWGVLWWAGGLSFSSLQSRWGRISRWFIICVVIGG